MESNEDYHSEERTTVGDDDEQCRDEKKSKDSCCISAIQSSCSTPDATENRQQNLTLMNPTNSDEVFAQLLELQNRYVVLEEEYNRTVEDKIALGCQLDEMSKLNENQRLKFDSIVSRLEVITNNFRSINNIGPQLKSLIGQLQEGKDDIITTAARIKEMVNILIPICRDRVQDEMNWATGDKALLTRVTDNSTATSSNDQRIGNKDNDSHHIGENRMAERGTGVALKERSNQQQSSIQQLLQDEASSKRSVLNFDEHSAVFSTLQFQQMLFACSEAMGKRATVSVGSSDYLLIQLSYWCQAIDQFSTLEEILLALGAFALYLKEMNQGNKSMPECYKAISQFVGKCCRKHHDVTSEQGRKRKQHSDLLHSLGLSKQQKSDQKPNAVVESVKCYPIPHAEEKVHHLYPFQRNANADLSLHTLLHAWVRNDDDDDGDDDDSDNYTRQSKKLPLGSKLLRNSLERAQNQQAKQEFPKKEDNKMVNDRKKVQNRRQNYGGNVIYPASIRFERTNTHWLDSNSGQLSLAPASERRFENQMRKF